MSRHVSIGDLGPAALSQVDAFLEANKITEKQRNSKYRSQKTVVDGITFDSKLEANRWCELRLMEKAGAISGLKRQVGFEIIIDGKHICTYFADFVYFEGNKRVAEDCKGFRTPVYKIKKKLVEACYPGVVIKEIRQ